MYSDNFTIFSRQSEVWRWNPSLGPDMISTLWRSMLMRRRECPRTKMGSSMNPTLHRKERKDWELRSRMKLWLVTTTMFRMSQSSQRYFSIFCWYALFWNVTFVIRQRRRSTFFLIRPQYYLHFTDKLKNDSRERGTKVPSRPVSPSSAGRSWWWGSSCCWQSSSSSASSSWSSGINTQSQSPQLKSLPLPRNPPQRPTCQN